MTLPTPGMDIIRAVAAKHGIEVSDLTGAVRNKKLWAARREATVALREAKFSFGRIGHLLKRGTNTVKHYMNPSKDCSRSKKTYIEKNGKKVRLSPETMRLITGYAGAEGVAIDVAANALIQTALGAHA